MMPSCSKGVFLAVGCISNRRHRCNFLSFEKKSLEEKGSAGSAAKVQGGEGEGKGEGKGKSALCCKKILLLPASSTCTDPQKNDLSSERT